MFTRYWRSYPPFLQLLLFVLMMFTLVSFTSLLLLVLLPRLTGFTANEVGNITAASPPALIRAALLAQAFSSFMIFMAPALLFTQIATPHKREYLGMTTPRRPVHLLLGIGLLLGLMPAMLAGQSWLETRQVFGAVASGAQSKAIAAQAAMLGLRSPLDQALAIITFTILPAVAEELLFRGVLMRFAQQLTRKLPSALVLSAFVFTALHPTPYGMPFIFLSGLVLGLIYWASGSLITSIAAHFAFNGIQILFMKLPGMTAYVEGHGIPVAAVLGGLLLSGLCGWAFWKTRTPLPPDWPQDYRPDEKRDEPAPGQIF